MTQTITTDETRNSNARFATADDLRQHFQYNNGWSRNADGSVPFGDPKEFAKRWGLWGNLTIVPMYVTFDGYQSGYYWDHQGKIRDQRFCLGICSRHSVGGNSRPERFEDLPNYEQFKMMADSLDEIHFLCHQRSPYGTGHRYIYDSGRYEDVGVIAHVTIDGQQTWISLSFSVAEFLFDLKVSKDWKVTSRNGVVGTLGGSKECFRDLNASRLGNWRTNSYRNFDYTFDTLEGVLKHFQMNESNTQEFLRGALNQFQPETLEGLGIKKLQTKLDLLADSIKEEDPLAYCGYRTLVASSRYSVEGVKVSSVFNELFARVETKDDLLSILRDFYKIGQDDSAYDGKLENCIKEVGAYKDKRKAVIRSKANRAFTKLMQDVESLDIDKTKYKRTWNEIEAGNLPLGTFFRKAEQYFLLNDNWDLWEEMFKRGYREQAIALAEEVKGRSTYEKDLMSYFYFVLYGLPEYLKKHTGKKWTCIPRLVDSADELEPPKEDDNGVVRKRSALTPIVDNEKCEVVVPYASLAIYGGFGTTYCYSHDYHVLTKGYSLNGYAVTNEVEKKLNGRDDYGLMFYTLTGSAQGRGYPTFLIIFERRDRFEDTRVHFHRTHPSRSKEGDYNPIHHWIKRCYNWVAGNIKADRIKAQQGDLFFVQVKTDEKDESLEGSSLKGLAFDHQVNQYDKHCFERAVPFAEYTKAAKSNILGYVQIEKETWLRHTEHDDVLIPPGTYAIHQCRSWEANPKGVWSLRID